MLKKNLLVGMCVFFFSLGILGLNVSIYAADTEVILEDDTPDSGFAVKNSSGETTVRAGGDGNVGIGTASPTQKLDVAGKIKVGDSAATPTAGTIRWTGTDFEGYDGTQWVSLTSAGGSGGGGSGGVEFETGRVRNGDTINPISGYTKGDCGLIVSMEDSHFTANYGESFADIGQWGDNHYAGAQAFYDSNWKITCRYGITAWDNRNPRWYGGRCGYMMICKQ